MNTAHQIIIFITGVVAGILTQIPDDDLQRYACIVALVGQPSFYYVTYKAKLWGMFYVTILYTGIWLYGVWTYWL